MKNNIFIPQKIKVGYKKREGTYTKKLAYVIYYDEKGVLRKQKSWEQWRDKNIEPDEFDNIPTEGFVINKTVGGMGNHFYDSRKTYVRIYDPRGFEFEITLPNLLFILENTNCIKGKGLEGEFVYGWAGADLVLIPVSSPEYKTFTEFAEKRYNKDKISIKDLKIGATYLTKDNKQIVYMGKRIVLNYRDVVIGNKPIFAYSYEDGRVYFEPISNVSEKIIEIVNEDINSKYQEYEEKLNNSKNFLNSDIKKAYMYYTLDEFKKEFQDLKEQQEYLVDCSGFYTNKVIVKRIDNDTLILIYQRGTLKGKEIQKITISVEEFIKKYKPYRLVDLKK